MKFYDLMRAPNLKRWHLINTVRQQTLADHLWSTTVIALELYQTMIGIDLGCPGHSETDDQASVDSRERLALLHLIGFGMFHDVPEVVMGDPPGNTAKDLFRKHGGPGIFTAIEAEVMPSVPYIGGLPVQSIAEFVSMADKIEALWWITENGVGVHAGLAARHCSRNLITYVRELDGMCPTYGWPDAVNKVLVALGMPYIYFDAMVSPP